LTDRFGELPKACYPRRLLHPPQLKNAKIAPDFGIAAVDAALCIWAYGDFLSKDILPCRTAEHGFRSVEPGSDSRERICVLAE
jgi:hypothetical protein